LEKQFRDLIVIDLLLGFLYVLSDYWTFAQADYLGKQGYGFSWALILIYPRSGTAYPNGYGTVSGIITAILNLPFLILCLLIAANIGYFYYKQKPNPQ